MSDHHGGTTPSRTDVDIATGILVGLLGCPAEQAHDELLDVAARYHLSLFRLSRALISLSAGTDPSTSAAFDVARLHWEHLVRDRDAGPHPPPRARSVRSSGPAPGPTP